jgi:DNA-binding PadR family transcriptional regulator
MARERPVDPERFIPLTPAVFEILLALADGERHGYAIMRDVGERTGGRIVLRPGTLYRAISRLLDDGLIEEMTARPSPDDDDERRRYYALTPLGRRVASAEALRLAELVRSARAKALIDRA